MLCISDAKSHEVTARVQEERFVPVSCRRRVESVHDSRVERQIRRDRLRRSAKLSGFFALLLVVLPGCSRKERAPTQTLPSTEAALELAPIRELGRARRFDPVLERALLAPSADVRHEAARSLGLIDDSVAQAALIRALSSDDVTLVAESARGLGMAFRTLAKSECDAVVVTWVRLGQNADSAQAMPPLARALATCESTDAEPILRAALAGHEEAARGGLARLARARKKLQPATLTALLEMALAHPERAALVLEPAARVPWPNDLATRARAALPELPATVSSARLYGQLGARARLVAFAEAEPTELEASAVRFEALRALVAHKLDAEPVFAKVLSALLPEEEALRWANGTRGARFAQVLALAPTEVRSPTLLAVLERAARLEGTAPRLDGMRCAAAARVVGSAFDAALIARCAAPDSLPFELARLTALVRWPLQRGRLPHFQALLASPQLRVREAALSAMETHPEALSAEWGRDAVLKALASSEPGEVIAALGVASKLGGDANAALAPVFSSAAAHEWPADASELFVALLTLGRARRFDGTEALARTHWCDVAQPVRQLAREIVQDAVICPALAPPPLAEETKTLTFETTAGTLRIHLDPSAAPISVAALTALAARGFYTGTEMHRVVPGFVVQFGDPHADGYGGSGALLPHEPSEHGFAPLTVGLAHAGYDTASAQLFVTTGPAPHLDGDYTWLGHAEGPWQDVVAGDPVTRVGVGAP